jgi:hypothetical protein
MAQRGIGADQIKKAELSTQRILNVLKDGAWHRYMEILKTTKVSPTTLTKRLKELEKGIVERKLDTESQDYPPPVSYRIRDPMIVSTLENEKKEAELFASNIRGGKAVGHIDSEIGNFLQTAEFRFTLRLLTILDLRFLPTQNNEIKAKREIAYNQYLENVIMPNFKNWLSILKEKLDYLEKEGINVLALLRDAREQIMDDNQRNQNRRFVKSQKVSKEFEKTNSQK